MSSDLRKLAMEGSSSHRGQTCGQLVSYERPIASLSRSAMQKVRLPPVLRVLEAFEKSGFSIRLVGGAVRDLVLGKVPKDFDFATNATPDEIRHVCQSHSIHWCETGLKHGTLTAVIDTMNFEITTLRADDVTDGRHAVVRYIQDWREDARRRDLTVNALSLTPSGEIYDYFGGLEDLSIGKVRFVNDARSRIREDYLRILRFFRFYGRIAASTTSLGDSFDKEILEVIQSEAPGLMSISVERIWVEISQIFVGNFAPEILDLMWNYGVLAYCRITGITHDHLQQFRVIWNNSRPSSSDSTDFPLVKASSLLSAFFQDVATAEEVCRNLKLSNADRILCVFIVTHRSRPPTSGSNVDSSSTLLRHYRALFASSCVSSEIPSLRERILQLMLCEGVSKDIINDMISWEPPPFPLKGSDLIKCGLKGPVIGKTLDMLRKAWIQSDFTLTKLELIDQCNKNSSSAQEEYHGSCNNIGGIH